jgi:hypothetical protein
MPFWAEMLILFGILLGLGAITALAILLQPGTPVPSSTPIPIITVTFIPPQTLVPVNITTKLVSGDVVCIAFDNLTQQLIFGNCGDTNIQGTWMYDEILKIAINNLQSTFKSNCMVNPSTIVNPSISGVTTSASTKSCQNILLDAATGRISGKTLDNTNVYIAFIGQKLGWVTNVVHAQIFALGF